ncbi:MAG: hypothetical protein QOF78_2594, partial [Phycisphaerales bacterium]|nr:hypothetical protein [Phycisphaerales bacterium]
MAGTVYVSPSGNDGTGTRDREDLPFATADAAMQVIQGGDTLLFMRGVHEVLGLVPAIISDISSVSRTGEVTSVTTASAHKLTDGCHVLIDGVAHASFNGEFRATVVNSTTFTYFQPIQTNATSSGGVVVPKLYIRLEGDIVNRKRPAQSVFWYARVNNVATLAVGTHFFNVGDSIIVSGMTPTSFNGTYTISQSDRMNQKIS